MEGFTAERLGPVTDLVYFGVEPTDAGGFPGEPVPDDVIAELRVIKEHTGCRLLLCVGGGGRSDGFPALVDARRRAVFVERLCRYCRDERFDGIDFDWEHPEGDAQLAAYVALVNETRAGLPEGALITVAQSPYRDFGLPMYEAVDRIHVMSYNHKFPQARLEDARADVARMLRFGCPREKLVLGVPFYGREQEGTSKTYRDIVQLAGRAPDTDLIRGYAFNCRSTIRKKVDYVREERLAGIMIWELGQDSTDPAASLLRVIERRLSR
jgi:GH18 family chitinase